MNSQLMLKLLQSSTFSKKINDEKEEKKFYILAIYITILMIFDDKS